MDVGIENYTDMKGNPLQKPLYLAPHHCAIGYTSLTFSFPKFQEDTSASSLVVTTKGVDVTTERKVQHGHFVAYTVGLDKEIVFIRKAEKPLDMWGDANISK